MLPIGYKLLRKRMPSKVLRGPIKKIMAELRVRGRPMRPVGYKLLRNAPAAALVVVARGYESPRRLHTRAWHINAAQ